MLCCEQLQYLQWCCSLTLKCYHFPCSLWFDVITKYTTLHHLHFKIKDYNVGHRNCKTRQNYMLYHIIMSAYSAEYLRVGIRVRVRFNAGVWVSRAS